MAMVVLVAGIGAAWAFTPGHVRDWLAARYLSDTPEQYQAFMDKHSDSKYYEPAAYRKAELEDTPAAYRDYLYEFTDAKFRAAATDALTRLEQKALGDLEQNPTLPGLRTFLVDFPETGNLDRVLQTVQKNEALRKVYLPVILQQMEECRRLEPLTQLVDSLKMTGLPVPALTPAPPTVKKPEGAPPVAETPAPATPEPQPTAPAPQGPAVSAPAVPAPAPAGNVQPPKMATVKGGIFQMGSADGVKDEQPIHQVTLQDFQIGAYEVTFAEYDKFCASTGRTPPADEGWGRGHLPVIHVSWLDAVAYCNWLSTQVGLKPAYTIAPNGAITLDRQSKAYRLPTEAEWEFAAKGGASQQAYVFSGSDELDEVAWHSGNSRNSTHPAGHKKPNDLGVYDLTGNVREWCHDGYGRYAAANTENPLGAGITDSRVIRGGMWGRNPLQQRNTYRNFAKPDYKDYGTGFRVARWR
ncbi:MAG: SUMF1/EgtB/PvdO family nonheme iron enzyme [Saprospirales bacterium]|nr:SUMF1/EgtB/PvdO family nonheme iron enzyme [Saprospirales bacterium]